MPNQAIFQRLVELSRREVLTRGLAVSGWGAFAIVCGAGAIETVDFFYPRVLFHPPSTFRVGTPAQFLGAGEKPDRYGVVFVDDRWKATQRFFIVRDPKQVYALSARCAHLGCTVNWFPDQRIYRCPCHGSEYEANGQNFAGPAPRPLDRFRIELAVDNELVVNTSIVYGPDRFNVDGAYVAI